MNCHELAKRIEELHSEADPKDVARLCLLLANSVEDIDDLGDDDRLVEAWRDINMRFQAATDQHAAMTAELDALSRANAATLDREQLWVLLRALKVQSQMLQFYIGASTPV
jgi:hypothetical protein